MKKLFLFLIGLIIFIAIFVSSGFDVQVLFKAKNVFYILFALMFILISITVSGFKVKYFLRSVNEKSGSLIDLIKIEYIGKFFYYFFPTRINIPIKAVLLASKLSFSKSKAMAITSYEYAFEVGVMIFFGLIGLSIFFQNTFSVVTVFNIFLSVILLFAFCFIFFLTPLSLFNSIKQRLCLIRNKYISNFLITLFKIIENIRLYWPKIFFNRGTIPALGLILISWIFSTLSSEFVFLAYGVYVPIIWVLTISAVSVLVGGLSQIPGGIGAREVTLIVLFSSMGVSTELVMILALVTRLFTIVPSLIGYIFLIKNRKLLSKYLI